MLQRRLQYGFVALLALFLFLSLAQTLFHGIRVKVLDQSRKPAAAPQLGLLLESKHHQFADALNKWVDDRIGFRDPFIKTKNQIDYAVFHTARKVYIGKNDFLFMRDLTNSRLILERSTDEQMQQVTSSFFTLAHHLKKRGVKLVVIINPDKSALYPEYLPHNVPNLPVDGRLEKLKADLAANPDIILIDALKLMHPHKDKGNLFYKTDIHPSIIGALPVVEEVIRRIAIDAKRPDIRFREKFSLVKTPMTVKSEDRFMDLLYPLDEISDYGSDMYMIGKNEKDGHWNMAPAGANYDFEYVTDPASCRHTLPPTLLFGNSFSDMYWNVGMHKYFCSIRRSRDVADAARLPDYLRTMPKNTRYFIFQLVGPQIVPGNGTLDSINTRFIN